MNSVNAINRERLKQSRKKITITGESRVAYARREITVVSPVTERYLRDNEDRFPAPIFLFADRYFSGYQISLMWRNCKKEIEWSTLREEWAYPDTDDDLWPRPQKETQN